MDKKPIPALVAPHGSNKQTESSDPMTLVGSKVPGADVNQLMRCFIEEYAAVGYGPEQILELFRQPRYAAIHPTYLHLGEQAVRATIAAVIGECGVFRVVEHDTESTHERSNLVQIGQSRSLREDQQP